MADDGTLSEDEIDALLMSGEGGGSSAGAGDAFADLNLDSLLSDSPPASSSGDSGIDQDALNAIAGEIAASSQGPSSHDNSGKKGGYENKDTMELLLDVTVRFTVELGRTQMLIKDVLLLSEGSIVELDKAIGEEVDVLINDRLFGRGKLVVMDEFFGIQVTHIFDPLYRYRAN